VRQRLASTSEEAPRRSRRWRSATTSTTITFSIIITASRSFRSVSALRPTAFWALAWTVQGSSCVVFSFSWIAGVVLRLPVGSSTLSTSVWIASTFRTAQRSPCVVFSFSRIAGVVLYVAFSTSSTSVWTVSTFRTV